MDPNREHTQAAARIAFLEKERRAAIMADDDRAAAVLDGHLRDARERLQRVVDKIRWTVELEQVAQAAARTLPETVAELKVLIEKSSRRIAELEAKLPRDRTARDDDEMGALPSHIAFLRSRLLMAERLAK
jgi:hypothetical protein